MKKEEARRSYLITVLGKRGHGKTYYIRRTLIPTAIKNGQTVLILDRTAEYGDLGDAFKTVKECEDSGSWRDLFGPVQPSVQIFTTEDYETFFAYAIDRARSENVVVVCDEADRVATKAKILSKSLDDIINLGRHLKVSCILAARRAARLHNDALANADLIISFRSDLPRDVETLSEWFGPKADLLPTLGVGDFITYH